MEVLIFLCCVVAGIVLGHFIARCLGVSVASRR